MSVLLTAPATQLISIVFAFNAAIIAVLAVFSWSRSCIPEEIPPDKYPNTVDEIFKLLEKVKTLVLQAFAIVVLFGKPTAQLMSLVLNATLLIAVFAFDICVCIDDVAPDKYPNTVGETLSKVFKNVSVLISH